MKYKIVTCVTSYNRLPYIKKFVSSWKNTISKEFENILIIADDGSKDGTLKYLDAVESKNIFIIKNNRLGISKQTNCLLRKSLSIGFDYGFKCDDDIWFDKHGWQNLYINAINNSGKDHLCYHNRDWCWPRRDQVKENLLLAQTSVLDAMGCFWTFTPEVIKKRLDF